MARWLASLIVAGSACVPAPAAAQVPSAKPPRVAEGARQGVEPATGGGVPTIRRLNERQYRRSIEQVFGKGINIPGRFEPPLREQGLLAIGDGKVTVSPSGIEQYELRAREIAAQVLAEKRRQEVLPCTRPPAAFDDVCARAFLSKYGRLLFRRPLAEPELVSVMAVAGAAAQKTGSFPKGLEIGLARLLASPHFIFRIERAEPDPDNPAGQRLDEYSLATRVSFLIWDAPPDVELLDAVAQGGWRRRGGVEKQVDRMLASPRFVDGVQAFFSDMLGYDQFDALSKDQSVFPKFATELAEDAKEQTLRTVVDLLVTQRGDYRDLFTTKKTFLNRRLGSLYKVPLPASGIESWVPYTFGSDDPRAGVLTLAAFLMLDPTHETRTSPTIRGKVVSELLLCQEVPPPPPNVDFNLVQDTSNPKFKTVRDRLTEHRRNPACSGCHAMTDPIGLSMENYDGLGGYRRVENDVPIDASGTFERKPYKTMMELTQLLHDSPRVSSCAVRRAYEYGTGRSLAASEREWLHYLGERFADDKYVFSALIRRIAMSKAFRAVSAETVAAK